MLKAFANCLQISVLPTPVGPTNSRFATVLFSSLKPARDFLIARTTVSIASS